MMTVNEGKREHARAFPRSLSCLDAYKPLKPPRGILARARPSPTNAFV